MLDKIKGIIARLTIKDEIDYCMYCILDTLNKNLRGLSYTTMRDTIGLYFTEKTFKTFQNVTVYITVIWYNNHAKGKKVPDAKY